MGLTNKALCNYLVISCLMLFAVACNTTQKKTDDNIKNQAIKPVGDTVESHLLKFNNTLFSVPSPYQAALLIQEEEIPYNEKVLNHSSNTKYYQSSFQKSINLGVYGADLAYISLYEQTSDAINYFSVIKQLAEELDLLGAFDQKTVERIEHNLGNKDSLLNILGSTYRKADGYFKDNQQEHLACLVIAGGWIESMYLLTQLTDEGSNAHIKQRIGENKKPLQNLLQLLAPYSDSGENYKLFVKEVVDLASLFEKVKIEYKFEKVKIDPDNQLATVHSETNVVVEDQVYDQIKTKILNIRKIIIK